MAQAYELALLAQIATAGLSPAVGPATQYLITIDNYSPIAGTTVTVSAQLADANGNPVHTFGKTVTWSKTGAGGNFILPTSFTNANGLATIGFTTSTTSGVVYVLTGTDNTALTGSSAPVTSVAGAASKYVVTSSDYAPVVNTGVTISAQLTDVNGNAVSTAGLVVTWSKTGAGGSFGSPTSNTNGSGLATVTFTVGANAAVAYVVTGTDAGALTGSTATITSALTSLNQDWLNRVTAAGGARPSDNTFAANDTFYAALNSAGITAKITICNLFAPDNLIAAITPLIRNAGNASWTNHNFVLADLSVLGMTGNGTTKYLGTGFFPGSVTTTGSAHLAVATPGDAFNITTVEISSCDSGTNNFRIFTHWTDQNCYGPCYGAIQTSYNAGGVAVAQFVLVSRTSTTALTAYQGNTAGGWVNRGLVATANANNASVTNELVVFADNTAGVISLFSNKRISLASCGTGLTTTEGQAFYNAFQAFRTSVGGGGV